MVLLKHTSLQSMFPAAAVVFIVLAGIAFVIHLMASQNAGLAIVVAGLNIAIVGLSTSVSVEVHGAEDFRVQVCNRIAGIPLPQIGGVARYRRLVWVDSSSGWSSLLGVTDSDGTLEVIAELDSRQRQAVEDALREIGYVCDQPTKVLDWLLTLTPTAGFANQAVAYSRLPSDARSLKAGLLSMFWMVMAVIVQLIWLISSLAGFALLLLSIVVATNIILRPWLGAAISIANDSLRLDFDGPRTGERIPKLPVLVPLDSGRVALSGELRQGFTVELHISEHGDAKATIPWEVGRAPELAAILHKSGIRHAWVADVKIVPIIAR